MHKNDFNSLFDKLDSLSIGFGQFFRDFQYEASGYPPHNIVRSTENRFILELAVAGFKKNEIIIEDHQGVLTIKGVKNTEVDKDTRDNYQFRGIGKRSFEKKFNLAEFIEVEDAQLADGLLSITLMRNLPEIVKPKLIAIK